MITKVLRMGGADVSNPMALHKRKKTFVLEPHYLEPKWRPRGTKPLVGKDK